MKPQKLNNLGGGGLQLVFYSQEISHPHHHPPPPYRPKLKCWLKNRQENTYMYMVYILHGQENEIDKMFSISESYLTPVG